MTDKFMYIPIDDTQTYPFYRLKLVVKTFRHLIKWTNQPKFNKDAKVVKPTYKETLL